MLMQAIIMKITVFSKLEKGKWVTLFYTSARLFTEYSWILILSLTISYSNNLISISVRLYWTLIFWTGEISQQVRSFSAHLWGALFKFPEPTKLGMSVGICNSSSMGVSWEATETWSLESLAGCSLVLYSVRDFVSGK